MTVVNDTTRKKLLIFIVGSSIAGVVSIILFGMVLIRLNDTTQAIRDSQKINISILPEIQKLAEKIESCTNPEGECAKRGQRQQASVIGDLNLITAITMACADESGVQTLNQIQACVKTQYTKEKS